jgi:hypothetical protein
MQFMELKDRQTDSDFTKVKSHGSKETTVEDQAFRYRMTMVKRLNM